jgi:hypothetical protein
MQQPPSRETRPADTHDEVARITTFRRNQTQVDIARARLRAVAHDVQADEGRSTAQ